MKLLLITGSLPPMNCGVGDYTYRLALALAEDNSDRVAVLTSAAARGADGAGTIDIFPVIDRWALSEASKAAKVIRGWNPDIVHVQYPTQGYGDRLLPDLLPAMSFLLGRKVVQTWHEGHGRRSPPTLFLKSFFPGGLVVVRPDYKEKLHPLLRWALWNKKYAFIPNASTMPKSELGQHEKHELRARFLKGQRRLMVFFGFVYPAKGVDLLFQVCDPATDAIVIAGETADSGDYLQAMERLASTPPWQGKVTIAGFLPSHDATRLMAAADAVILPFREGGGEWNTSLHAAVLQGSFVLTTSRNRNGYDPEHNVYYAKLNDVREMRAALGDHAGTRRERPGDTAGDEWRRIAARHRQLYEELLSG